MPDTSKQRRDAMVETQLRGRGITDPLVLNAMEGVPREAFVSAGDRDEAYEDRPLPIGADQTISQPYMVAYMTEALQLKGGEKVLEIGTGCGYAAAILAEIAGEVFTIERLPALADLAQAHLTGLGYTNIHHRCGDGTLGWPAQAPFDAIIVTAAGPGVPPSLRNQLRYGGRLVMPIGATWRGQMLVRITRHGNHDFEEEILTFVAFVPLIGEEGWDEEV